MFSMLRRMFGGKRVPVSAFVCQGWDQVPDGKHFTVRAVFSLEEGYTDNLSFLTILGHKLLDLAEGDLPVKGAEAKQVKKLLEKGDPGQYRRWPIPGYISDGVAAEFGEFAVPYGTIPPDATVFDVNQGMLPCLVQPDENGVIEPQRYTWEDIDRRQEQRVEQLRERGGVFVSAVRVQANYEMFEPGGTSLPGLVLFTFDREAEKRRGYLHDLATRLYALKTSDPEDEAEAGAKVIIEANEKRGEYHRRARLPKGFTGGPLVYAADIWFHRPYIPKGHFSMKEAERFLRCIAEPGESGGFEHAPPRTNS
jgi:hypothetical protein